MDQQMLEDVYTFIRDYTHTNHGLAPTLREIATGCYISHPTVLRYLDVLEIQGRIARQPGRARSIRLLNSEKS
jgi:SOS-response transcriptional repressor LexA